MIEEPVNVLDLAWDALNPRKIFDEVFASTDSVADPDPVGWAERNGAILWSKQKELMRAVAENSRVAVKSAHNMGKSFSAAQLASWWIDSHPRGDSFVVTTAPTNHQVKSILWKEIRRVHSKAGLPGKLNLSEWWLNGELVAFGRKPADWDPDAFQGIHALYVLVIIDEASGVPDSIWEAAESLASNEHSKILAIGNPTTSSGKFARVCRPDSGWKVIHIDGYDSPNFTDEGKTLPARITESLLSPSWAERMAIEWGGKESAPYVIRVRGEFPPESAESVVVPWHFIERVRPLPGVGPEAVFDEYPLDALEPVELGVDIAASEKGDETVIRERRGPVAYRRWGLRTDKPEEVTQTILAAQRETGASAIKIDGIGWGWGVVGSVRERLGPEGVRVIGYNVAEKARNSKKFHNLRSELWWKIGRKLCEERQWDLSLVDEQTLTQLHGPHYSYDVRMRVKVEPKSETVERIGKSPDDADALLLAFAPAPGRRAKARARSG